MYRYFRRQSKYTIDSIVMCRSERQYGKNQDRVTRCTEYSLKWTDPSSEWKGLKGFLYWRAKNVQPSEFFHSNAAYIEFKRPPNNLHIIINRWRFSPLVVLITEFW